MHPEVLTDHYHVDLIRNTLTRQLNSLLPEIVDEVEIVCGELLPMAQGGQFSLPFPQTSHNAVTLDVASLPGSKTILDIVSRIISRAFIGQPLCRSQKQLSIHFTA